MRIVDGRHIIDLLISKMGRDSKPNTTERRQPNGTGSDMMNPGDGVPQAPQRAGTTKQAGFRVQ